MRTRWLLPVWANPRSPFAGPPGAYVQWDKYWRMMPLQRIRLLPACARGALGTQGNHGDSSS